MTFLDRRPAEDDEDYEDRIRHTFEIAMAHEENKKQAIRNIIKAVLFLILALLCFEALRYIARW